MHSPSRNNDLKLNTDWTAFTIWYIFRILIVAPYLPVPSKTVIRSSMSRFHFFLPLELRVTDFLLKNWQLESLWLFCTELEIHTLHPANMQSVIWLKELGCFKNRGIIYRLIYLDSEKLLLSVVDGSRQQCMLLTLFSRSCWQFLKEGLHCGLLYSCVNDVE